MIIRRRHTANFTTIGNALFDDERLAADEVGILAYLLSRPHDWEVRRPALMRRWKIGRDTMRRIVNNLMRTGWCRVQKTRLSNGTFHVIYEIRDEPGRELTEDEIRGALSLVSSEAAEAESDDETQADQVRATGDPPTPEPGVADQRRLGVGGLIEDSLPNTDSVRTEHNQSARGFERVREAWPSDHVLSFVTCEALHAGLTDADREKAIQGLKPYLDDCRTQNRKVCDLATYYRERRWERFANKPPAASFFATQRGTPQAMRWRAYFAEVEPSKLRAFDDAMNGRGAYTTTSEWPPAKAAASLMTEADDAVLTKGL